MISFVNSPVELQAATICVTKKVLSPARFFLLDDDANIYLVIKDRLPM